MPERPKTTKSSFPLEDIKIFDEMRYFTNFLQMKCDILQILMLSNAIFYSFSELHRLKNAPASSITSEVGASFYP